MIPASQLRDEPELRLVDDAGGRLEPAPLLAEGHELPTVDLPVVGVDPEAVKAIALPVLNRVVAIPFAVADGVLKIAITDPQDVRALDELRLATRQTVEFHVAARRTSSPSCAASRARPRP